MKRSKISKTLWIDLMVATIIATMSFLTAALSALCIWAILFHSPYTAVLALLGVLVFLPWKFRNKKRWAITAGLFLFTIALSAITFKVPVNEINDRISYLRTLPRNESDISSFSTKDKIGIYGLNILMGMAAYPLYPEASKETLMMALPRPENGTRTFNSEFPVGSEIIRDMIMEFRKELPSGKAENAKTLSRHVVWPATCYPLGSKASRYALALNPSDITLSASRIKTHWQIHVTVKVLCRYPRQSYVTLLVDPELKVEEGLFWVLQQAGWLFPYTAEWKFIIQSNDARING